MVLDKPFYTLYTIFIMNTLKAPSFKDEMNKIKPEYDSIDVGDEEHSVMVSIPILVKPIRECYNCGKKTAEYKRIRVKESNDDIGYQTVMCWRCVRT